MTTTTNHTAITGPGLYTIDDAAYHADPIPGGSLSSSGARRLLATCPAVFRHEQLNPPAPRKAWDIGTAAHRLVLGTGPELVRIDADEWRTKEIKAQVADVRARGGVPLKPAEYQMVHDMADAIRRHPIASALFNPEHGRPEQTLVWQDDETGVWCRARLDWLPTPGSGRLIIPDYKTCRSAAPGAIARAIAEHGYHMQDDWYRTGARALGLADDDAAFVFVFQEKTPPYLITVVEIDPTDRHTAAEHNRAARRLYADCVEADYWPGYADTDITLIRLPEWATRLPEETL